VIRLAREDDLERLRSIERAAGRAFAGLGMDRVAEDEPLSVDELREYQRGLIWLCSRSGYPYPRLGGWRDRLGGLPCLASRT
jgi:hypothetical protein